MLTFPIKVPLEKLAEQRSCVQLLNSLPLIDIDTLSTLRNPTPQKTHPMLGFPTRA